MHGGYAARAGAASVRLADGANSRVITGPGEATRPGAGRICHTRATHVTYYLFAPQGSGEAESLTPLKRRTTPLLKHHSLSVPALGSRMEVPTPRSCRRVLYVDAQAFRTADLTR